MKIKPTLLNGVLIIEPDVYKDGRGFFLETYQQKRYADGGVPGPFVQDNQSRSARGILRGLHAQLQHPQGKLIRVLAGEIFDVVVDIRKGSPTYKEWLSVNLSADNFLQCYVPPGYAHGFCVLSEAADVVYKVTDFYNPSDEVGLIWNDPELAIAWPLTDPILSAKDKSALTLREFEAKYPQYGR